MSHRIAILGAAGRMGRALARCLLGGDVPGLQLAGALESPEHPQQGADVGELAGAGRCDVLITDDLLSAAENADVAIDFSFHAATAEHAAALSGKGTAMVIGTTGLTDEEFQSIEEASIRIPIVLAPNMSVGVNLLFSLAEQAAAALRGKGYDIEIVERHHRLKKDAPSGTALGLGRAVARGLETNLDEVARHGREGITGERTDDEIGFHSVRGGDVVGDHTVIFATSGELIELSHRATTRDTFAIGALRAATWVAGRKAGLYSMKDVLKD
jgi:4-hydroxy-tetrahydrodipicolinate reductase